MSDQEVRDQFFRKVIAAVRYKPTRWERIKPLLLTILLILALATLGWIAALYVTSPGGGERFQ